MSNLKWNSLLVGLVIFGSLMACNGNGNQAGDVPGEDAAVDAVAEPVPTPVGDVEALTEDAEGLQGLLPDYMDVKDALVNDNFEKVKQEARDLQEQLSSLEGGSLDEELEQGIQYAVNELVGANDIQSQRNSFATLSSQLYQVVLNKDVTDKTLYWQHCPMAMNNKGANWLSFEENIQNPFMGQKMPKCGSVQETLNN